MRKIPSRSLAGITCSTCRLCGPRRWTTTGARPRARLRGGARRRGRAPLVDLLHRENVVIPHREVIAIVVFGDACIDVVGRVDVKLPFENVCPWVCRIHVRYEESRLCHRLTIHLVLIVIFRSFDRFLHFVIQLVIQRENPSARRAQLDLIDTAGDLTYNGLDRIGQERSNTWFRIFRWHTLYERRKATLSKENEGRLVHHGAHPHGHRANQPRRAGL